MAKTSQCPVTTAVDRREEASEHGTYDCFPFFSSSFKTRKREDEKQYRTMLPGKGVEKCCHKEEQTHWKIHLCFHSPASWGCSHCSWCFFSSLWASRMHFPLCSLRRNSSRTLIYSVGLHQWYPSISVGTAVSICKSKWAKTEASNRNADILGFWDYIFL